MLRPKCPRPVDSQTVAFLASQEAAARPRPHQPDSHHSWWVLSRFGSLSSVSQLSSATATATATALSHSIQQQPSAEQQY